MNIPPFTTYPSIANERVSLQQIRPENYSAILPITIYEGKLAKDLKDVEMILDKIHQDYTKGNSIHWGIFNMKTDQIVGTCGYYRGFEYKRGELGYVLLEQFRRKGYMTDAAKLAIDFGLYSLQLEVVFAITNKNNVKAIKLLKKSNFYLANELEQQMVEFVYQKS